MHDYLISGLEYGEIWCGYDLTCSVDVFYAVDGIIYHDINASYIHRVIVRIVRLDDDVT